MKLMQTHMKNKLTNIEKCSDISDKKQSEVTETDQCDLCEKWFAIEDTLLKHKVTHNIVEKMKTVDVNSH